MSRYALLAVVSTLLSACGGSLFQTKAAPPTMYVLSAPPKPAAGPPAQPIAADLSILKPHSRPGLSTDRIAALYPDRRLDYFADVRWSASLDQVIQYMAVQEFHLSGALRNVSTDASMFPGTYWLEIEVTDFQAEYAAPGAAPTVRVQMQVRLGLAADRQVLARFEAQAQQAATDNRMSAIVDAYTVAADQAFGQIVAGVTEALKVQAAKN
jgi:cholesterol transport system auxiliary component